MRKIIFAVFVCLLISCKPLLALKTIPVVELPNKPTNQEISSMLKAPEQYAGAIIDYYYASACYQAQLSLMGITTNKLIPPSLQNISTPSASTIKTQWLQAEALYKQVKQVDLLVDDKKDTEFRESIYLLRTELMRLRQDSINQSFQIKELEIFKELYESALQSIENFKKQYASHVVPLLGVSAGLNSIVFHDNFMAAKPGASLSLYLNTSSLLNSKSNSPCWIDCWLDYATPTFEVVHNGLWNEPVTHQNTYLAAGASIALSISKLLDIENYRLALKPGLGYYWMDDNLHNLNTTEYNWNGLNIKIEAEISNLSSKSPCGLYVSYAFLNTNSDLALACSDPNYYIPFGKQWFGAFNIGLRFYLISNYY